VADVVYSIEANLRVGGQGQFQEGLGRAAKSADSLQGSLKGLAGGAAGVVGGIVDIGMAAVGLGAKVAAGVGGGAIIAAGLATKHIGASLAMLEDKGIQLASVMAASTGIGFAQMQKQSAELFDQFRADAIKSAGETADFVNVASMIAGPIMGAGKSMKDLHDITASVINAAPAMGIKFEQAGSDVMRMLQGVAGVEQPLFRAMVAIPSLGIKKAEEFNKLSPEKRFQKIKEALGNDAFKDAAEAAGNSWTGLMSTLQDVAKTAGGALGAPIFERGKRALDVFTKDLIKGLGPGGMLGINLKEVGNTFASRLDGIGANLRRLVPDISGTLSALVVKFGAIANDGMERVVQGSTWIADHWGEIVSGARAFAQHVRDAADHVAGLVRALGGGDMAKGVERLAEIAVARQAAAGLAPVAGAGIQAAQGAIGVGKWAAGALGGGGAAAGAAGVAATAASTAAAAAPAAAAPAAAGLAAIPDISAGALAGGGIIDSIAAGISSFGAFAAAIPPVAIVIAAVVGAIEVLRTNFLGMGSWLTGIWDKIQGHAIMLWGSLKGLWSALGQLYDAISPVIALIGVQFVAVLGVLGTVLDYGIQALDYLVQTLRLVVNGATLAAQAIGDMIDGILRKVGAKKGTLAPGSPLGDKEEYFGGDAQFGTGLVAMGTAASGGAPSNTAPKAGSKGGGKVEVTIKWDLGDGNEEAILVRARKDFVRTLHDATSIVRGSVMPGS